MSIFSAATEEKFTVWQSSEAHTNKVRVIELLHKELKLELQRGHS
jgi:hypothetical protein